MASTTLTAFISDLDEGRLAIVESGEQDRHVIVGAEAPRLETLEDRLLHEHLAHAPVAEREVKRDLSFGLLAYTMRFDRLGAPSPHSVRLVYAPGSGIPFFRRGRTRFLFIATATLPRMSATQARRM